MGDGHGPDVLAAGTAPKTAAFSAYRNNVYSLPNVSGDQNVLSLDLPAAGTYVVWGKVVINNNDSVELRPTCQVKVGTDVDYAWVGTADNAGFNDVETANVMLATTVTGPTTAVLECTKPSSTSVLTVEERKLVAIKVDSLVNTAATGPSRPTRAESK